MARPSDLTPALQTELINALHTGVTIKDACAYVGITESAYFKWMDRGRKARKGDEIYIEFFQSATRARVAARIAAAAVVRRSALGDDKKGITPNPDDAKWYLERTDPEHWGKTTKHILDIDPTLLKRLKQTADSAGVDLASVFESMIQEFANVDTAGNSEE